MHLQLATYEDAGALGPDRFVVGMFMVDSEDLSGTDHEGWCLDSGELIRGDGSDHERLAIVSVLYWLYPIGW